MIYDLLPLKTQLLITLLMWQGGLITSFRGFFFKKKKSKSCHVDKNGQKLCLKVAMYHISINIHNIHLFGAT
jgi:hypothetical protein